MLSVMTQLFGSGRNEDNSSDGKNDNDGVVMVVVV